jgi:hypothetical protein
VCIKIVRELLLGDNPFLGISHLSQDKARDEAKEASLQRKVEVFEAAVEGGARGFTFTACESNLELLTFLSRNNNDLLNKMNYYILVPYAHSYVRRSNIGGTPVLLRSTLRGVLSRRPLGLLEALMSLKLERFAGLFIEAEIAPYLRVLPKDRLKAVLLHEVLTELAIAFNLVNLLRLLDSYVEERLGVCFGLETRNFGHLHRFLSESGYCPKHLMTPINSVGYQMAPNMEAVEGAVEDLGRKTRIIAVNVLASGVLNLDEAIEYIAKYEDKVYAVASASTKPHRIRENFRKLSHAFLSGRSEQTPLHAELLSSS